MPDETYTVVTSQSWFGRIWDSFKGIIVGILFIPLALWLMVWNEGRAVQTAKSLAEGAAAVVTVSSEKVEPANDQKLVHMTGTASTKETLTDPEFGVSAQAIKLRRRVETYEWKESVHTEPREKLGGGSETTKKYTYSKEWSDTPHDSSGFQDPARHQNPKQKKFEDRSTTADNVTLGAFKLSPGLLESLNEFTSFPVEDKNHEELPAKLKERLKVYQGLFYESKDPAGNPEVGDTRIRFEIVKPAVVSIIARQVGDTFEPYPTKVGKSLEMLELGTPSAAAMFQSAMENNTMTTWILRGVGWFLTFLGIYLLFQPLVAFAKVVPFMGDLLGFGIGLFSAIAAAIVALITIGIGWLAYRPVAGGLLLFAAVAVAVGWKRLGSRYRKRTAAA